MNLYRIDIPNLGSEYHEANNSEEVWELLNPFIEFFKGSAIQDFQYTITDMGPVTELAHS
jgi:hypothetical protein